MSPIHPSASNFGTVDGAGLWANFTRTFKTPIEALMDILDNAVDAAGSNAGKIRIDQDIWNDPGNRFTKTTKVLVKANGASGEESFWPMLNARICPKAGIVIRNNSSAKIQNINDILTVFHSAKGNASETIGQNGVGLKQGCAAIADVSFILIKNGAELSFGVVAKMLQKEGSNPIFPGIQLCDCVVPIFNIDGTEEDVPYFFEKKVFEAELRRYISRNTCDVGACIAAYGGGNLDAGIFRLANQFEIMFDDPTWSSDKYVFTLVMNQLRQRENDLRGFFKELKETLPKTYIHIPDSFDFRVCDEKIFFKYWQMRMVELTSMELTISKSTPLAETENLKYPSGECYDLRVFIGFDPVRAHDRTKHSALCMHIYSRQSGRLVSSVEDARSELRLNTSGTDFCQGLTLIVDDHEGNLTLNPRKDGIAFSEERHPNVHKDNLHKWLGVIAKTFWQYHSSKFPKTNTKGSLTAYLEPFAAKFHEDYADDEDDSSCVSNQSDGPCISWQRACSLPNLSNGDFSTFNNMYRYFWLQSMRNISNRIITGKKQYIGKDTTMRIIGTCKVSGTSRSIASGKKKKAAKPLRKLSTESSVTKVTRRKRKNTKKDYAEDSDSDSVTYTMLDELRSDIRKKEKLLDDLKSEMKEAQQQHQDLELHASALGNNNEQMTIDLHTAKLQVDDLKEANSQLKGERNLLMEQARTMKNENQDLAISNAALRRENDALRLEMRKFQNGSRSNGLLNASREVSHGRTDVKNETDRVKIENS